MIWLLGLYLGSAQHGMKMRRSNSHPPTTPGLGTQLGSTALSMGEVLGLLPKTEKQSKLEAFPL